VIDEALFFFDLGAEKPFVEFGSYNRDLDYAWIEV